MTGALYPREMSQHGPTRSLEQLLAQLIDRHGRLSTALREGTRIANRTTLAELRELHSSIRQVEAAIDERGAA